MERSIGWQGFLRCARSTAYPRSSSPAPDVGPHWLSPGSTPGKAMTSAQEAQFDRLHGHVMARLGYPTALSEPEAVRRTSAAALVAQIKNWLRPVRR
jgi:hypothetical protein